MAKYTNSGYTGWMLLSVTPTVISTRLRCRHVPAQTRSSVRCEQTGEEIGDGRSLVMLSATEGEGDLTSELDAFLRLTAGKRVDEDKFNDDIKKKIEDLVQSPKWMEAYMTFEDELRAAAREAELRGEARERTLRTVASMLAADSIDEVQACELLGVPFGVGLGHIRRGPSFARYPAGC